MTRNDGMNLEYTVGIFDVESESDGYATITNKVAEGTLISIDDKELKYNSTAIFTDRTLTLQGVDLKILNQRGEATVDFPKELSIIDKRAILNQRVRYSTRSWSSLTEGMSRTYTLEILSGVYAGEKLTRKVHP